MTITGSEVPVNVIIEQVSTSLTVMPLMVDYNIYDLHDSLQDLFVARRKIFLGLRYIRETPMVSEKIPWTTLCLSVRVQEKGPLLH